MKTIGLIERNNSLRNLYTNYFKTNKGFKVVFSVANVADAVIRRSTQPQVIFLDVNMPSYNEIDAIKLLNQSFPDSKIIVLSSMMDARLNSLVNENVAAGYLVKVSSIAYTCDSLLQLEQQAPNYLAVRSNYTKPLNALTKREIELIQLLTECFSNKAAADMLNVTYFTINQHLKNIYKKLNINSKPELISWYLSEKKQDLEYIRY